MATAKRLNTTPYPDKIEDAEPADIVEVGEDEPSDL